MTEINIIEDENIMKERFMISMERIAQIPMEESVPEPFRAYFRKTADFILMIRDFMEEKDAILKSSFINQKKWNHKLYKDILPENYGTSYGNPTYACKMLGREYGQILSAVYAEIRGMVVYAFEDRLWDITILCELFLEIYNDFEQEELPSPKAVKQIFYWYVSDYSDDMMLDRISDNLDPEKDFAYKLIMNENLSDLSYLYKFGEYISENELKMASFLNTLPQAEIDAMARTYTEGYRIGFITTRKDISKKKVVNIRYNLGFERMIRAAILQFEEMGLKPTIYRYATHVIAKRQQHRIGYTGAIANKQFDYDHRGDAALFLDEDFVQRKLRTMQNAYEQYKELADVHGGPAVVEIFGEVPFVPENKEEALSLSERQQKLQVSLDNQSSQITNRYIKGEERSFTIIAYPIPEIGDRFEEIFKDIVKINNLDYKKYERIQQTIIDALDQGEFVHIKGAGKNRTDLTIALQEMKNPEKETIFENCVADVNIPVGEVFTTPKLAGTDGILHVSKVYLNELLYKDLCISFENGKVCNYECKNFPDVSDDASNKGTALSDGVSSKGKESSDNVSNKGKTLSDNVSNKEKASSDDVNKKDDAAMEDANKKYIRENILYHHETLPMGEFAIGTNTTAYVAAQKYGIQEKMPILIAEKMGPHFAVGDTCYSWSEDTPVYNQNGKEIIARDNEVSILRKSDLSKAYYGCHTDITIPYEEIAHIQVVRKDGSRISIIENGRFVLAGTEELNEPLECGV